MDCKNCGKDTFVVVRKNDTTEFRIVTFGIDELSTKQNSDGTQDVVSRVKAGWNKYKGNWRVEEKKNMKILGIRCNSCDKMLDEDTFKHLELKVDKIDKNKGVHLISTAFDKFY
jgi:uncharacterized OB-fold protein